MPWVVLALAALSLALVTGASASKAKPGSAHAAIKVGLVTDIGGFIAGRHKAEKKIKELNGYSQDFVDQAKCKEVALNQIAQGSSVEFQVAGGCGLGVLDAAKQKGIWGIGVDSDQRFLGPQVL